MKKTLTSVALAAAMATSSLVAEDSGFFGGVNLGYGAAKPSGTNTKNSISIVGDNYTGFRYGLLGGYKEILSSNVGMRYYATLDFGGNYTNGSGNGKPEVRTINLYANGDALFNFAHDDAMEYGAFVGLALGYVHHKISGGGVDNTKLNGFDLGVNVGLRAQSFNHHSLEIYSRFGLLNQDTTASGDTYKVSQPYQVGVRYIYSF